MSEENSCTQCAALRSLCLELYHTMLERLSDDCAIQNLDEHMFLIRNRMAELGVTTQRWKAKPE